jgi:hypothetical protein
MVNACRSGKHVCMATVETPAIRASTFRDTLDAARAADKQGALAKGPAAALFERIASLTPMSWIEIDDIVQFYDGLWRAFGAIDAAKVCHDSMLETLKRGMFKDLTTGAKRVHGLTPMGILEYGPRTYVTISRACGSQQMVRESDTAVRVKWSGVPSKLIESEPWAEAMMAKYEAQVTVTGRTPSVSTRTKNPKNGEIVFSVSWKD